MKSIHFKFIWILVVILVIYGCIHMVNVYYPHLLSHSLEGATGTVGSVGTTSAATTSATRTVTSGPTLIATTSATTSATPTATSGPTTSATTSATPTATPTAGPTYTPTPLVTTPPASKTSDVGGHIQSAIDACATGEVTSVVEHIRAAINAQTDISNYAVVELLQVSLGYFIHYENEGTLTNWNLGKIFLYAANYILSLLSSENSYDYGNNIQSAVKSLNTLQKDINTAMTYTSNAVSIQQANGNTEAVGFLKQAIKYLQLQLQNISVNAMSPLQMALYEYASALANLDMKNKGVVANTNIMNATVNTVGPSGTQTCTTTGSTTTCTSTDISGGTQTQTSTGTGSWWNWGNVKTQYPMNVPKVVQNFLNARAMFNESDQELIDYLSEKEGYDALIKKLNNVKDEMSNL